MRRPGRAVALDTADERGIGVSGAATPCNRPARSATRRVSVTHATATTATTADHHTWLWSDAPVLTTGAGTFSLAMSGSVTRVAMRLGHAPNRRNQMGMLILSTNRRPP